MNLRSIDLNLLVVLDALVEERSVRRAADRIGLSQSATSHALERLRNLLDDELLVRTSTGMEPTPRALDLAGPVRLALEEIQGALAAPQFDPARAQRSFTIGVETYETIVVLPRLVDIFRNEAPGLKLLARSASVQDILAGIDQGRIDLGVGLFSELPDRFMTCRLLSDRYVCAMRSGHPLASVPLTLDAYCKAAHLLVSMSGAPTDPIDHALMRLKRDRDIAMRLPHGLAAVIALARSDMIASMTCGAAKAFSVAGPLVLRDLPFETPLAHFRLVWNRRFKDSPAHMWLRRTFTSVAAEIERQQRTEATAAA
ncbi:MAG TPA: LysR family transcriptional regulator [Candidatus Acidoferrum sp.]|nr:LysR family transcriptional regulator [Candidatus Acidoferrum sp.]